ITPIGYTPENRRFKERMIRRVAKANSRYQWEELFFEGNFKNSLTQEQAGQYTTLLEMVRLGPSAGNKQPWRIIKEFSQNIYHFYVRKSKDKIGAIYSKFAPLDIGIAVCHFDLTAKELKVEGRWEIQQPEIKETEGLEYVISWYGD
ncbi:MAG: nitroreductase family protein, partial [Promethearchaeota archaeon]